VTRMPSVTPSASPGCVSFNAFFTRAAASGGLGARACWLSLGQYVARNGARRVGSAPGAAETPIRSRCSLWIFAPSKWPRKGLGRQLVHSAAGTCRRRELAYHLDALI
jgi:hypothetical protein